jgi:hypothetical protein
MSLADYIDDEGVMRMLYVVETPEKNWRLVEDVSRSEYMESARRMVLRSVDFRTLATGDGDDVLLVLAGMGMGAFGENCIMVLTEHGYDALIASRQGELAQDEADFPSAVVTHADLDGSDTGRSSDG